jgi:chromosomal replication initiator protein
LQGSLWQQCLVRLESELPEQQFNTWIRPLHAVEEGQGLKLLAPNRFVLDWVKKNYIANIQETVDTLCQDEDRKVELEVGSARAAEESVGTSGNGNAEPRVHMTRRRDKGVPQKSNLNPGFTFDNFVEGKSNQLARAASLQIAENPGEAYNPLFIYGGVGLGKTHLMQAVGNTIVANRPGARVVYLHSERFVADMVKALQHNAMNEFKRHYRSVDALLIDDIQFFAGKERSHDLRSLSQRDKGPGGKTQIPFRLGFDRCHRASGT